MVHRHETDENADRAPQEVGHCESDRDILLAIDGAGRLLDPVGVSQQRCDLDFLPYFFGRPLRRSVAGGGGVAGK